MKVPPDLLTRIVAAEAASIADNHVGADQYLTEISEALSQMEKEYATADIVLPSGLRRLGDRGILVRANQRLRSSDYRSAISLLEPLVKAVAPTEYYLKVTLAQFLWAVGDKERAGTLFQDSYGSIQALGHLAPDKRRRNSVQNIAGHDSGGSCAMGRQRPRNGRGTP